MKIGFGLALALALMAAATNYKVTNTWKIGGEGGWDYLTADADQHLLYISRGTHVDLVDTTSGKKTGEIPDTPGIHGIALAAALHKGFTSNGRENTVTVFDYATHAVKGKIKLSGQNPDAILFDPTSKLLFTFNGRSSNASVIDPEKETEIATIPLSGKPEFGVADGKGMVFVNIEDKGSIARIDAAQHKVTAEWKMDGCESPSGLAIDRKHRRLFSVCDGKVMAVTDADTGKQVAKVAIGEGPDAAGFDDDRQLAFSSNGDGTITVVHEDSPDKFTVLQNVETKRRARTMTFDPKTHKLYTVTAEFGPAPAATAEIPRPRPPMVPDSFVVIEVSDSH